jgi:Domain of unknown function (DUF1707)
MADNGQAMLTERDQREAVGRLREAAATGAMPPDEIERRTAAVWKAVTPRDLWKATAGLAGSPKRADAREWRKAVVVVVAMFVFAAVAMAAVVYAFRDLAAREREEGGLRPSVTATA